jgi:hypothetical protein
LFDLKEHSAGRQVDRFILLIVVLKAERVAGVDVNHLADVALGLGPMQLITPGLIDFCHLFRHIFSL